MQKELSYLMRVRYSGNMDPYLVMLWNIPGMLTLANLGGGNLRGTAHVSPEELSDPETIV